jgi:hypothetical protein
VSTCPKNTTTTAPIKAMPSNSQQIPQQYRSHRSTEGLLSVRGGSIRPSLFDTVDIIGTPVAAKHAAGASLRHAHNALSLSMPLSL